MATQPIRVLEQRFGLVPARFEWGGRILQVDAVERCWTELADGPGEARYHYRVRCGAARYQLSEEGQSGRWTGVQEG